MADFDVEDISELENLDDDSVRKTLKTRYNQDKIYTNCGDILLAVNPFKDLHIFEEKQHEEYDWKSQQHVLPPHVFCTAASAYRRMVETRTNQVIFVGGESGSGKTETIKYIVKHLVVMCSNVTSDLHERILKINPLLEAFGNAKTTLSENSSRFAKFLEMTFSPAGQVTGATVRDYLLEKSRVVDQMNNEGNFHIFYCLFAGAPAAMLKHLGLKDASTYRILKKNRSLLLRKEFYRDMYLEQIQALKSINMDSQDVDIIHIILAAILHITQVDFTELDDPNEPLQIRDCSVVKTAADLLDVSYEDLGYALISTKQTFLGETLVKSNSLSQAIDCRDSLAKALYERLFSWIVFKINLNIHPSNSPCVSICILDVAGFGNLESNGLEQLCINFMNEKLQHFANRNAVDFEMSLYREEGFHLTDVKFQNNDAVLDMFMKKPIGILPLLDEESKLGEGTNERLISNLNSTFDRNKYYTGSSHGQTKFGIKHFVGQVWYDGSMFIEKNRDLMSEDITSCMRESENPFVSDLFKAIKGPTGTISRTANFIRKSKRTIAGGPLKPTSRQEKLVDIGKSIRQRYPLITACSRRVGLNKPKDQKTAMSYFQKSLDELLVKLKRAEPHFIRCIKPNTYLQPNNFDDRKVAEQIRYNGISEVAKIRKLGLPVRKRYGDFAKSYRPLCLECLRAAPSPRVETELILAKILPENLRSGIQMGETRIFMKEDVYWWLEKCLHMREKMAANFIARRWKKYVRDKRHGKEDKKAQLIRELDAIRMEQILKDDDDDDRYHTGTTSSPIDPQSLTSSLNHEQFRKRNKEKKRAPLPPDTRSIPTEKSQTESNEQESKPMKKANKEFWDIFKIVGREPKRDESNSHFCFKVVKIITYLLLGLLLLACSVVQKISLATLVSNTSGFHHTLLLIVMCIPYILMFLASLRRFLFGKVPWPLKKNIIIVVLIEGLHSMGLSFLTFRVLPEIDVVRGIMLLSCTCIVPSLLKPLCCSSGSTSTRFTSTACRICAFLVDVLAALTQISAIPVLVLTEYYINSDRFAENIVKIVEVIVALFFCSLSYWENFVDDRFCGNTNKLLTVVLRLKLDLQECRPILLTFATPVKVLVTGLVAFYLDDQETQLEWTQFVNIFEILGKHPDLLTAIPFVLSLALSSFIGHFIAYTACKLQMQIFSFTLPLLISTPLAVYTLYADCQEHFLRTLSLENRTCDAGLLDTWWHLAIAAGWLVSVYWIGRHIWFPRQPLLAKFETLLVSPVYCGILMEQHLIMNRRRHTRRVIKVENEGKTYYRLSFDNMRDPRPDEKAEDIIPPMVYACGTMWHESRQEMVKFLKSLFRMDKDQYLRKKTVNMFGVDQADVKYYEFEPHIFFDDAFETNADNESVPNSFVNLFMELMEEAASSVHEKAITISDPVKISTPYGGQLVYLMPGENFMFIHLKNTKLVRQRKRWSQVMYMYYLLGYRILKECQEVVMTAIKDKAYNNLASWRRFERETTGKVEKNQIFNFLDDEVLYRAQNTFILALDGDVEFTPGSVHLLIDRLKKNDRVGAVCGRIHPTGNGPVVWFQQFEYAIAHWLQKATEHVLGCVLCSPGCFSMFRGSSLMDDNVMKKFTILPTDPSQHLMFDQGEDRWLCTLLLQQGYRIDYTAASDVFTQVPEGFGELFEQRRRWMPSSIANTIELLQDGRNTVAINKSISWVYIIYQYLLLLSTLIAPGLVIMMVAGSLVSVFDVEIVTSYVIAFLPVLIFILLCFTVKPNSQITAAQFLGTWYIFIMAVVFIGVLIIAVQENPLHPSVIFIEILILVFIFTAFLHPHELSYVIHGAMYYLCIPLGYLLIVIYSLCNMHNTSWGTREVDKKKSMQEIEEDEKLKKERKETNQQGFLARFFPKFHFADINEVLKGLKGKNKRKEQTAEMLRAMNKNLELLLQLEQGDENTVGTNIQDTESIQQVVVEKDTSNPVVHKTVRFDNNVSMEDKRYEDYPVTTQKEDMTNPRWVKQKNLGNGPILKMNSAEAEFWKSLIHRYLYPLNDTPASTKHIRNRLQELRNNVCVGIAIINLMWISVNFMFQLRKPATINFSVPSDVDVDDADVNRETFQVDALGLLFVIFFGTIILIQFIGMTIHRWGTCLHLLATTELTNPFKRRARNNDIEIDNSKSIAMKALEFCERLDSEPVTDDPVNSDDEEEEDQKTFRAMAEVLNNMQEKGTKSIAGSMNPLGKSIRQTGLNASSNIRRSQSGRGTTFTNPMMRSILRRTAQKESNLLDSSSGEQLTTKGTVKTVNDIEKGISKLHFSVGAPLQKHFMSEVRNRKIANAPEDFLKKEPLSRTLTRGDFNIIIESDEDTDNIYDTTPAVGIMDKTFVKKFKKFRRQENWVG